MKFSLKFLLPAVEGKLKKHTGDLRPAHMPEHDAHAERSPKPRRNQHWTELVLRRRLLRRRGTHYPLTALTSNRVTEMPRAPRLSIGLVMISKGYLTDEQLRFAIDQSKAHGEELETSLIRLGLAGEKQVAAARAAQWGYPVLGQDHVGQPVETDIPGYAAHHVLGRAASFLVQGQARLARFRPSRGTQPASFHGTAHGLPGRGPASSRRPNSRTRWSG